MRVQPGGCAALWLGVYALTSAGCSDTRGMSGDGDGPRTAVDTGGAAEDAGALEGTAGVDEDGAAPRLDVDPGTGEGPGDGPPEGCEKIDFLFVIDNSASMSSAQQSLADSFPGFISAIEANVGASDYHIMVTDTDDDPVNFCRNGCEENGEPANHLCEGYQCGSIDAATGCDLRIGAGVVAPLGGRASNEACGVPEGQRFVRDDQDNLSDTFACMGKVGVSGNGDERSITSMLEALTTHSEPGGCNEGFLRDDAILVVTIVTNADSGTAGTELNDRNVTIEGWRDQLVAVKHGDETAIVMIGLVHDSPLPPTGAKYARFVEQFGERGYLGNVADSDYAPLFSSAITGIAATCDAFVPPG